MRQDLAITRIWLTEPSATSVPKFVTARMAGFNSIQEFKPIRA